MRCVTKLHPHFIFSLFCPHQIRQGDRSPAENLPPLPHLPSLLDVASMSPRISGSQAASAEMDYIHPTGTEMMASVEMFPSSAVAQSHVPGSAAPCALQQPPPSSTANSFPSHHRTASIFQNPSFDNKHSAYRSAEVSVSVNKVVNPASSVENNDKVHHQYHHQPSSTTTTTTTSTNTATSSAMMVDDTIVKAEVKAAADAPQTNEAKADDVKQQTEANADATGDAGSDSAVRKVR